jgi:hypothetical protein
VLCCVVLCCVVLCCVVLCCFVLCCVVPCRAVPCRAVPCRAVPCCAVLCRAVPCCAQVAPNYPIVRNNLAVALTDLGTTLKVRGQLKSGVCFDEGAFVYAGDCLFEALCHASRSL